MSAIDRVLADSRRNAALSWLVVLVLLGVWSGEVLTGRFLWSVFSLVVIALAIVPPIAYRSLYVMLPWEVLVLAALPVLGLAIGTELFTGPVWAYLAVAAIGLVLAVELQSFTAIRFSTGFAIVLVAASTMAAAGLWALVRWGFEVLFSRPFVITNEALMLEFFYSMIAGIGAGVIFAGYFRRFVSARDRLPSSVKAEVFEEP